MSAAKWRLLRCCCCCCWQTDACGVAVCILRTYFSNVLHQPIRHALVVVVAHVLSAVLHSCDVSGHRMPLMLGRPCQCDPRFRVVSSRAC